jgi:type III secretion protein L
MSELPSRPPGRILRAEEADLWVDGYAFIKAAEARAQTLLEDSARTLEKARQQASERARQEGARHASTLLAQTSRQVDTWLTGLEPALVDLTLDIVREVLGEMDDTERLLRCTRKALDAFKRDQALTLFVPAADVEAVQRRVIEEDGYPATLVVHADEHLGAGQARLSSPAGSVELGIETQLSHLRLALLPMADGGDA